MFLKQLEVGRLAVFAYLLGSDAGAEGLVIDPADDIDEILAIADQQKITIRYILNTHAHVDHIMGNEEIKKKTGAKIIIHEEDAPLLTRIPLSMLSMFGGNPSPPADLTVKEGDLIRVGDLTLKVLHTPGHSPGGMCLQGDQAVFTGDTLFVGGVGRTDLPGGSWPLMLQSIKTKLLTLPDETIVYPGHNYGPAPTSTIKNERLHNPYIK
ncbi:MAG: MBL fold metallo-hydrolase [Proteobacteria bacterium]|nr:MBL fold metallo-hydrolase [Pseudomonadota bacterium]